MWGESSSTNERLEYNRLTLGASRAMSSLDSCLKNGSLEASLIELVKIVHRRSMDMPIAPTCLRRMPVPGAKANNASMSLLHGEKRIFIQVEKERIWFGPRR